MYLTHPLALLWLLLAIPLVALYFLQVKPRQQAVSTVSFWERVVPDSRPRRWWRRLRDPLSLLIQLVVLALLAIALAEPAGLTRQQPRRYFVVLDTSASMQATDVQPTRFAAARGVVRRLVDGMGAADEMAIITAGTVPRVITGPTSRRRLLRQLVGGLRASDAPASLGPAVALAQRVASSGESPDVIVVTDPAGRQHAEQQSSTLSSSLQWFVLGAPVNNLGITQFQVRRPTLDPVGLECLVEVSSFADQPHELTLEIELNGELIDVLPLTVEAQQREQRVLSYISETGGQLVARLADVDALPCDNQAYACLSSRMPRQIDLITPGNRYLEKALAAVPLVQLNVLKDLPDAVPASHHLVIHRVTIDPLPQGRVMIVDPLESTSLWQIGEGLPETLVGTQAQRSPLLTHVALAELPIAGSRELVLSPDAQVLAATLEGVPICAVVPHDRGEVLLLNVNLQSSDFAWRTAFPLLMSNAVNWLVGQSDDYQPSYAAGDVVELERMLLARRDEGQSAADEQRETEVGLATTPHDTGWLVESPRGEIERLVGGAEGLRLGPLEQAGVWTLKAASDRDGPIAEDHSTEMQLACNLVNRQESNLRAGATGSAVLTPDAQGGQPAWFYLLVVALLILAAEWWLFQRRWVG